MFLDKIDAAQAHRETYIAVINSALSNHGDKQTAARVLGLLPHHLSETLNPGVDTDAYTRKLSPARVERLVRLLSLDPEIRQSLLEHIYLAWAEERVALSPHSSQRWLTHYAIADLLNDIGQAHVAATSTSNLEEARHKYRVIRRACQIIVRRIDFDPHRVDNDEPDLNSHPLEFVQVCLFLHDVQCVLNRADDALAHAKYAYQIIAACVPEEFARRREYFDHLLVNTAVAECLAYRNLNLPKEAIEASYKAEQLVEEKRSHGGQFWVPHIYMNRLKAIIERPSFTVGDVDGLVRQIEEAYKRRLGDFEERWYIQLMEARARGYLQYGIRTKSRLRLRKAGEALLKMVEQIDHLPIGPVQKTRLLRTYGKVQWHLGALDAWRYYVRWALQTASSAGLDHQLVQAKEEYGSAVMPIIKELQS
ncbi:MAG TPA: hypothetical protein VGE45_02350 [Chloroflexia bacterium]|jgi:hypothetical protein